MNEYKTGDKVRLRSGGPQMTIAGAAVDGNNAPCAWFAGLDLKIAHFPLLTLESSPERQPEGNTEVLANVLAVVKQRLIDVLNNPTLGDYSRRVINEQFATLDQLSAGEKITPERYARGQQIEALPELIAALRAVHQTLAAYLSDAHITMSDKLCQQLELQTRQALLKAGVKL